MEEVVEVREVDPGVRVGGRGVYARSALAPGTLISCEAPLPTSTDTDTDTDTDTATATGTHTTGTASDPLGAFPLHVRRLGCLLRSEERAGLLKAVAGLCPRDLAEVDEATLAATREQYSGALAALVAAEPADGGCEAEELLRLLLVYQQNAFYSGLYVGQSMVNHACRPNCVKLIRGQQRRSFIYAVADIPPGDEITISYLQPAYQTHARRAAALRRQHLFEAGPDPYPAEMRALSEAGRQVGADKVGLVLADIEAMLDEEAPDPHGGGVSEAATRLAQLCTAKEQAGELVGPHHIVLARLNAALVETCRGLVEHGGVERPDSALVALMLRASVELREVQDLHAHRLAYAVGVALDDVQGCLKYLLRADQALLFAQFPARFGTFAKASRAEHQALKRSRKIRALYGAG